MTYPRLTDQKDIDRFNSKCFEAPSNLETPCLLFKAAKDRHGYARFSIKGYDSRAHRLNYFTHNPNADESLCVCHRCDVRECVNPDHLFLATNSENIADMDAKGRRVSGKGENHSQSKLTDEDVREIRESSNWPQWVTAKVYGVQQTTVSLIVQGKTWTHIK